MEDAFFVWQRESLKARRAWTNAIVTGLAGVGFPPLWVATLGYFVAANITGERAAMAKRAYMAETIVRKRFAPDRADRS
jgi:hypothetical protein